MANRTKLTPDVCQKIDAMFAADLPVADISKRLQMSERTIARYRSGQASSAIAKSPADISGVRRSDAVPEVIPKPKKRASDLRSAQMDAFGDQCLDASKTFVERALNASDGRETKDYMTAAGIAVDKARVISGQATSISEERSLAYVCLDLIRERDKAETKSAIVDVTPIPDDAMPT